MSSAAQTVFVAIAIVFSYVWVNMPELNYYSLQLLGVVLLLYFFLKYISHSTRWRNDSVAITLEIALLSVGFLVAIASSGNLNSPFFPFISLYLFFIVMALEPLAAMLTALTVVLFHYALAPQVNPHMVLSLASLPALITMFMFAKKQYIGHQEEKGERLDLEEKKSEEEHAAVLFIKTYLQPKLETLWQLSSHPEHNKETLQKQIQLIHDESEELLEDLKGP